MKKMLLFAAAATIALSSCVESNTVYTDAPQEIAFKAVSHNSTKAPIDGTVLPTSYEMGVYALYTDVDDNQSAYFSNAKFVNETGNVWHGSPVQYWPTIGKLEFTAYAPHGCGEILAGSTINAYNLQVANNRTAQNDILYSDRTKPYTCPYNANVPLLFHHSLAQICVELAATAENQVTLNSVVIEDVVTEGTLGVTSTATVADAEPTAAWSDLAAAADYTLDQSNVTTKLGTTLAQIGTGLLVVPTAQTQLVLTYTINGVTVKHPIDLTAQGNWEMGKRYIYKITVGLEEIKFVPTVEEWDPEEIVLL